MSAWKCSTCGHEFNGQDFSPCPKCEIGSTHSLQRPCSAATVEQLVAALDGLVQECEYSASSGLPFNFPEGKGRWTQLGKAKALLAALRQNTDLERRIGCVRSKERLGCCK